MHDLHREQPPQHGEQRRRAQGEAQAEGEDLPDAQHVPLAPVLGDEHRRAAGQPEAGDVEDDEQLAPQIGGGDGRVAQLAQHDDVHHVHAQVDDVLDGDGQGDGQHPPVEIPVGVEPGLQCLQHKISSQICC